MAESEDECELTALVGTRTKEKILENNQSTAISDENSAKNLESEPCLTTCSIIAKPSVTPASPNSNKISSSGANSLSSKSVPKPSGANTRFLYVNPKLNNISRRPSLLSESSGRTSKEQNSASIRMTNMKRDCTIKIPEENCSIAMMVAPPNSPNPSSSRSNTQQLSDLQVTQSSEPDTIAASTETLVQKSSPLVPSLTQHYLDAPLVVLQPTESGHTALRHVASSAFLKSFFGNARGQHGKKVNYTIPQQPCFVSDTTDVRQMEQALLQLLEDFHSEKLRAFDLHCKLTAKDSSMEQMQAIREQQERLARLHFELGAQQELFMPLSQDGLDANRNKMQQLMSSLQQLSLSIEKLQSFSRGQAEGNT